MSIQPDCILPKHDYVYGIWINLLCYCSLILSVFIDSGQSFLCYLNSLISIFNHDDHIFLFSLNRLEPHRLRDSFYTPTVDICLRVIEFRKLSLVAVSLSILDTFDCPCLIITFSYQFQFIPIYFSSLCSKASNEFLQAWFIIGND